IMPDGYHAAGKRLAYILAKNPLYFNKLQDLTTFAVISGSANCQKQKIATARAGKTVLPYALSDRTATGYSFYSTHFVSGAHRRFLLWQSNISCSFPTLRLMNSSM
ncbi:MAG TPA: hypothetical protein VJ603_06235, partial [Paucimonas sp.]|nr:hypothetical protein [Paucimonas sp.]